MLPYLRSSRYLRFFLQGLCWLDRALARVAMLMVRGYQLTLSYWLGRQCRFEPSCSHYSIEAYQRHGAVIGSWLTFKRLLRCHPFSQGGIDNVPEQYGCHTCQSLLEKSKAKPH